MHALWGNTDPFMEARTMGTQEPLQRMWDSIQVWPSLPRVPSCCQSYLCCIFALKLPQESLRDEKPGYPTTAFFGCNRYGNVPPLTTHSMKKVRDHFPGGELLFSVVFFFFSFGVNLFYVHTRVGTLDDLVFGNRERQKRRVENIKGRYLNLA